ncbi:hypothetical protein H477_3990 [[Clostridium] sordellii ATCC 9714]|nr:hypothetical protein H477_3990 [[Clostridium] sordellii ATCC 9714] [Paeniclostridium sordellii ATCC 9714]
MKVVKEAISSKYLNYGIDEDIVIHEGNFCIYLDKLYNVRVGFTIKLVLLHL